MKTILLFILVIFIGPITVFTQTVSLPDTTFNVGETISISWGAGSGSGSDWLGVYKAGETPGADTPSSLWDYVATVSGSVDMENLDNGAVDWALPAGDYFVALLLNDSYTIANSFNFTLTTGATVSTNQAEYSVNEAITITYADGLGLSNDWVAIYDQSIETPDSSYLEWSYVTEGQEAAGSVVMNPTDLPQGDYYAVLLTNDSYIALSDKANFTVSGVASSVNELNIDKIGVYPNPVTASAIINMEQTFKKVELFDKLGRRVLNADNLNTNVYELNANNLQSGLYIVRIYADRIYDSKIIVR